MEGAGPSFGKLDRIGTGIFVLSWLAIVALAVQTGISGSPTSAEFLVLAGAAAVYPFLGRRRNSRHVTVITLISLLVTLYISEIYVQTQNYRNSKLRHVVEYRDDGVKAYPLVIPYSILRIAQNAKPRARERLIGRDGKDFPLSGIGNAFTVHCAEAEGMIAFDSDRFGFRNPPSAYDAREVDFVLLGDSFAYGDCVEDAATYRASFAARGATINFAISGASLLMEAAIYREYALRHRPRHVIWFYYEGNDVQGLRTELAFPPLRRYLDPDYRTGIADRTAEISDRLKAIVDASISGRKADPDAVILTDTTKSVWEKIPDVLRLRQIGILVRHIRWSVENRIRFRYFGAIPKSVQHLDNVSSEMERIWRDVVSRQRRIGGDVLFVYVPSVDRYTSPYYVKHYVAHERMTTAIWSDIGARHVSLTRFLADQANPADLYSYPLGPHFNSRGYRETARYILQEAFPDRTAQTRPAADAPARAGE